MKNFIYEQSGAFYLIGIGGVSMSAIAKYLKFSGKTVAGSDNTDSVYTQELVDLGITVDTGCRKGSIKNYDVVIYTDAVKENDIQLTEARKLNKTVVSRGVFLYEMSRSFEKTIAVSGCHGKTTCTAMLAHIFKCADKKFCAHIGGRDNEFHNLHYSGNEYFITEACEYKRNFLYFKPYVGVVLNSEPDHLECYGSEENLIAAYDEFCQNSERSVKLYDDKIYGELTFGLNKNATYCADNLVAENGCYSFTVYENGNELGCVGLNVVGKHNVLNALAAIAVSRIENISFEYICSGLGAFSGVERRMQTLGVLHGAKCIADYAHHPSEIGSTLSSISGTGKLFVVFQPHTYSRTKNLFYEFVKVLSTIDNLLIYKTFSAREYFDDEGSALTLSHALSNSKYGENPTDVCDFLKDATAGDIVLFLGAGDIYDIAKELID